MSKLNEIIEWQDRGTDYKLYIKHYPDESGKLNIQLVFEDATRDKVTEIHIPSHKVKQFLNTINGDLLSKKYEIKL